MEFAEERRRTAVIFWDKESIPVPSVRSHANPPPQHPTAMQCKTPLPSIRIFHHPLLKFLVISFANGASWCRQLTPHAILSLPFSHG